MKQIGGLIFFAIGFAGLVWRIIMLFKPESGHAFHIAGFLFSIGLITIGYRWFTDPN